MSPSRTRLLRHSSAAVISGLALVVTLAGCGSDSKNGSAAGDTAPASGAAAHATTTTLSGSSSGGEATTTTRAGSSGGSRAGAAITVDTICSIIPVTDVEAATGKTGLVATPAPGDSNNPAVRCVWDTATPVQGSGGWAFLSYDATQSVSYSQQPNDHGLHGFQLDEPDPDALAYGIAHPGTGRGVPAVTWVVDRHPVYLRLGEATSDGSKTIALAQEINTKLGAS